ncbi:MAG TPA: CBS domain-containing protein [Longimicrobiales bacterium]|nr:CBS domain-containing protein [Longimicrobiales bacterium]
MLSVRELMTPDPVTLESDETLRSAAEALVDAGVSGAPVTRGGDVVGVVSLTDILSFEADEPGVPTHRPELLGPLEEEYAGEPEALEEPLRWLLELWEDVPADVVTRIAGPEGPEWDALDEHTVDEVMSRVVFSVEPRDTVMEAARRMTKHGVHRLLVVEDGEAVGILSASDLVRAVAGGLLVPRGLPSPAEGLRTEAALAR